MPRSSIAGAKLASRAHAMTLYLVRHAESMNNKIIFDHHDTGWGRFLRFADPDLSELGNRQAELLGEHVRTSPDPISEHLRHCCSDLGPDRFAVFSSPMRRALKTTWGMAKGMGNPPVTVLPAAFEHGGLFHMYPELSDLKGLDVLRAAGDGAAAVATAHQKETHYDGLTAAEVTDSLRVSEYLGLSEPTDIFRGCEPGMEKGWWATQGSGKVETRKACFARGAELAQRFVDMAKSDAKEAVVLVSHGDLMDCILKALVIPGQPAAVQDASCRFVHANTGITRVEIGRDGTTYLLKQNAHPHLDADHELLTGGELVHDWDCWDRHHADDPEAQSH